MSPHSLRSPPYVPIRPTGDSRPTNDAYAQAIQAGANVHNVYDSRAATYEKLGKFEDALKDSGRVIKIAPTLVHVSDTLMHPEQYIYLIS